MNQHAVAVLGASGLIGEAIARELTGSGHDVAAVARRFTPSQRHALGQALGQGLGVSAVTTPLMDLDEAGLAALLQSTRADIVVNCLGVLQDSASGTTHDVHAAFIGRLTRAITSLRRPILLVHLSIPGKACDDETAFSRSKRDGERSIAAAGLAYVILRPGFVIAPAAYGGSALIRSIAALPFDLPQRERARPFAVTAMSDITRTITHIAGRWRAGERNFHETWEILEEKASSAGDVVDAFRRHLGGPAPWLSLPTWMMETGSKFADWSAALGWRPPIRTTARAEMRRGVEGDPSAWMAATGLKPHSLDAAMTEAGATIADKWFARLYLLKALVIAVLVVFWIVSGAIALFVSFDAASAILSSHGFSPAAAKAATLVSSLGDIAVGVAIAVRRTCRAGLIAGILVSLGYKAGAAVLTPDVWIEPLGALVKTGPAIVLMLVALAILDDR